MGNNSCWVDNKKNVLVIGIINRKYTFHSKSLPNIIRSNFWLQQYLSKITEKILTTPHAKKKPFSPHEEEAALPMQRGNLPKIVQADERTVIYRKKIPRKEEIASPIKRRRQFTDQLTTPSTRHHWLETRTMGDESELTGMKGKSNFVEGILKKNF